MDYGVLSRQRSALMGIATLVVMLFHCWSLDLLWEPLNVLRGYTFGGADMFLFLSALGVSMSLLRRPRPYGQFLWGRLTRLLPLYWAVVALYDLWRLSAGTIDLWGIFMDLTLLSYWFHLPTAFNWYIPCLLLLNALTPMLLRFLEKVKWQVWVVYVIGLIAAVVGEVLTWVAPPGWLDLTPRVGTYLLGLWAGRQIAEKRPITKGQRAFWWGLLALGILFLWGREQLYAVYFLNPCYLFPLIIMPLCLGLGQLVEKVLKGPVSKGLAVIGEASLEIYLINASFFIALHPVVNGFTRVRQFYLYYLMVFVVNIAVGALVHKGLEAFRRRGKTGRG